MLSCRAQSYRNRSHPKFPGESQEVRVREATPTSSGAQSQAGHPLQPGGQHPSSEHPLSAGVSLCLTGLLCPLLGVTCNTRTHLMLMGLPHTSSIYLSSAELCGSSCCGSGAFKAPTRWSETAAPSRSREIRLSPRPCRIPAQWFRHSSNMREISFSPRPARSLEE